MSETIKLKTAYIVSIIAGILIILGSLYTKMWGTWLTGGIVGMMGRQSHGIMTVTWILGLISGIIVLYSAIMLKIRPGEADEGLRKCCIVWGTMILIFSIFSLVGGSMGGFLIGAILGIIGGALALLSRPKS
ncbi:MAG: hypothetical protein NWF08_03375 [Candidatus Bathyarchaeota archaeon]|nr:hypothetical protein [Candidatus Bathyarchaeota archaeon]